MGGKGDDNWMLYSSGSGLIVRRTVEKEDEPLVCENGCPGCPTKGVDPMQCNHIATHGHSMHRKAFSERPPRKPFSKEP